MQDTNAKDPFQTFTAISDNPDLNEWPLAKEIISKVGAKSHTVLPSVVELFESLPALTWHQDEPFGSTTIYAQWAIFQAVRQQCVKVMLDGQGSDEQLAGYQSFFGHLFHQMLISGRWGCLFNEMKATSRLHQDVSSFPLLANRLLPEHLRQFVRRRLGRPATKPGFINLKLLDAVDRDPSYSPNLCGINALSRLQLLETSIPMLLRYEDRNSMAHGIESRTPFLDYRLVEFSLGLPSTYKLSQGVTKRVLRESMRDLIPNSILSRTRKLAFDTAEADWIRRDASETFIIALKDAVECSKGILLNNTAEHLLKIIQGKVPYDRVPWRCISFGQWMNAFSVSL
jgi:asparagine synthase (glutamine-hydrolysing)